MTPNDAENASTNSANSNYSDPIVDRRSVSFFWWLPVVYVLMMATLVYWIVKH